MFVLLRESEDFDIHYVLETFEQFNSTQTVFGLMNLTTWREYAVVGLDKLKVFSFDFGGSHELQIINDLSTMCRTKHEYFTGRINCLNTGWFICYQGQSFLIISLHEVEEDYVLAQAFNVVLSETSQIRQFFYRDISYPSEDYGIKFIGLDAQSKEDFLH